MAAARPRNVPWADWDEWLKVRISLFTVNGPGRCDIVRQGLDIVEMWKTRGRVPHAVESTAQLLEIQLLDDGEVVRRGETELRLQYSLAVIRAVNGLVDPSQQGTFADSIFSIAQTIGLPGWIVELRHEATHNQLPSLGVLRSAARHLIEWYHVNYWQMQCRHLEVLSSSCMASAIGDGGGGSALLSSGGLLEKSSTILSEIFVPLFLESVSVQAAQGDAVAQTLRLQAKKMSPAALRKLFNQHKGQWWQRLSEVAKTCDTFIELLVCHIFAFALASFEAVGDNLGLQAPAMERRIGLCEMWVAALSASKIGKASIRKKPGMLHVEASTEHGCWLAVNQRVTDILDKTPEELGRLRLYRALKQVQSTTVAFYTKGTQEREDDDEENVQEMEEEEEGEEEGEDEDEDEDEEKGQTARPSLELCQAKRQKMDTAWKVCKDLPQWPMGLVPGIMESRLYSIVSLK